MSGFVYDRAASREIESKHRSEIVDFQAMRLRSLATEIEQAPFWKEKFARAGFQAASLRHPDDLFRAPTLDKHEYFGATTQSPETYGGLLVTPLETICAKGAMTYRTTGTSGKQGRFINTTAGFEVFSGQ